MNKTKMLTIENLTVSYSKGTKAVDNISLSIAEGEIVALLGPSGCGKTSTLRCIAGLEEPVTGTITIGGEVVVGPSVFKTPQQRDINMVFQSYAVWPHMTVFGNVAYGLRARKFPTHEIDDRVRAILATVRLDDLAKRYPWQLSGGQQQRVALARAIVTEPKLILFDEPLSNLDAGLRVRMRDELAELQRKIGKTAVYVTHDQEEAMAIADRIVLMNKGHIEQEAAPEELYRLPRTAFAAQFLGRSNLLSGILQVLDAEKLAHVTLASGHQVMATVHGEKPAVGQEISVAIRPEAVKLHAAAGTPVAGRNQLAGKLVRSAFLGGRYEMVVEADHGLTLHAETSDAHDHSVGDDVVVTVDPGRALVLAR